MKGYIIDIGNLDIIKYLDMHDSYYAESLPRIGETVCIGTGYNMKVQTNYNVIGVIHNFLIYQELYVVVEKA